MLNFERLLKLKIIGLAVADKGFETEVRLLTDRAGLEHYYRDIEVTEKRVRELEGEEIILGPVERAQRNILLEIERQRKSPDTLRSVKLERKEFSPSHRFFMGSPEKTFS